MILGTPSSQEQQVAPIGFALDDPTSTGSTLRVLTLAIRPQELSRAEPSRSTVHQTLGGAWVDGFGAGLPQISINGHTGWHRFYGGAPGLDNAEDGADRFYALREQVFDRWHQRRERAVKLGMDPSTVRLLFVDGLHETTHVVVPMQFALQRSRSQPLLHRYSISMVAIGSPDDGVLLSTFGTALDPIARGPLLAAGLASMQASTDVITRAIGSVRSWIDKTLGGPALGFMRSSAALFGRVQDAARGVNGIADSLILVARDVARAGQNVFHSVAAVVGIPGQVRARAMEIAAAYRNIFCVLRNAISGASYYEDYRPLYGASNCSSTSGGSLGRFPTSNTFSETATPGAGAVAVPTEARASLSVLASADPVNAPMDTQTMAALMTSAQAGIA